MAKETNQIELSLAQVNEVWRLWDKVGKVSRHLAISNATGLSLATVRAVTFGQYKIDNGVAIVTVPAKADHTVEIRDGVVAGRE